MNKLEETFRGVRDTAMTNQKDIVRIDTMKLEAAEFEVQSLSLNERMNELQYKSEDLYNRLITVDNYLDKYQPYNAFT